MHAKYTHSKRYTLLWWSSKLSWIMLGPFRVVSKNFKLVVLILASSTEFRQKFQISRLCPTSLIKFPKIFHFIYWQFGTIWNSLEPFSKVLDEFRGIPSKILCFSENAVTWKILIRIRYDSYIGILRPFGTISEVFEKSSAELSAEDSLYPYFPEAAWSVALKPIWLFGLLYLALCMAIWKHMEFSHVLCSIILHNFIN